MTAGLLATSGDMWFTTSHEGVYRFDGENFYQLTEEVEGLADNQVWSVAQSANGGIWFGTSKGLSKYNGKTFSNTPLPWKGENNIWGDVLNPGMAMALLEDKNGLLWIGTAGGGAYSFDGETFTNYLQNEGWLQEDSLHHNWINNIIEDREGNLWFTSMTHGGVSKYDGHSFENYNMENGLKDDMILSAFEDSKGNLWFGSLGNREGGLHKFDGQSFTNYTTEDGLPSNNIRGIYEDKNGHMWLSGFRGELTIFDGQNFNPFKWKNKTFPRIRFILEDANGNVWFGGNSGRLFRYDWKAVTDFTQK